MRRLAGFASSGVSRSRESHHPNTPPTLPAATAQAHVGPIVPAHSGPAIVLQCGPQTLPTNSADTPPNPKLTSTLRAHERWGVRKNIRASTGTSVTATIRLATRAKVFVHASGVKSFASRPVRKNTGRKLTTVVDTAVITAGTTSLAACRTTCTRTPGERATSAGCCSNSASAS